MAKRPTITQVRAKQNQYLRYIVTTDIQTASRDLNVSSAQLRRFLKAKPETVKKNKTYNTLLRKDPIDLAKQNDVKLVPRLSGERLKRAYSKYDTDERAAKSVRYTQVVRKRRRVTEEGITRYVPLAPIKGEIARKQILANMGGTSSKSIMHEFHNGSLSEDEARTQLIKLFANSGVKAQKANDYFEKNK